MGGQFSLVTLSDGMSKRRQLFSWPSLISLTVTRSTITTKVLLVSLLTQTALYLRYTASAHQLVLQKVSVDF